jgi:SAM-dependent methyltransferase
MTDSDKMANSKSYSYQRHASYYDLLYRDKDYWSECNFLEDIFREYSVSKITSVLDVGCGTGGHSLVLARRGYQVTGVDLSNEMVEFAQNKGTVSGLDVTFQAMDIRKFSTGRSYDAVISMFASLGYVTDTTDLLASFQDIRNHLATGGIFAFDVWNGLAVLHILPSSRSKVVSENTQMIIRLAEPELDVSRHLCTVHYRIFELSSGQLIADTSESHLVRYFFPLEIKLMLEQAGFTVLAICPFMKLDSPLTFTDWNMSIIARAI